MEHDQIPRLFVSPYGRQHVVQHGVEIKRSRTLRDLLVGMADRSVQDLNPEHGRGLRMRLLHDATS